MRSVVCLLVCIPAAASADDRPPRSLDERITIELFAEQPQVVTPTGIDVDRRGRVWVIESNTHFRPEDYDGHPSDRLLIMTDTDGDGRADDVKTFADGFTHAMSVAVRPIWMQPVRVESPESRVESRDGDRSVDSQLSTLPSQLFLATRAEILLLEDTDGDDVCDGRTTLVHLETEGDYPHNGLAGFAFDALDRVYFGFGENLGEPYEIIGRDGVSYSGGGEGGNMYRMRPDGTSLEHWATGFWNPYASCVDAFGRLFAVGNDPDSRPPCRLLHIIEGGDYGYRFRNGRKGLHPFTSWNGEIPGTLPMVAGTGEAPSGILAYEHDAFPEEYLGNLIVTSWGDHRIDRFVLQPRGASFESIAEPLIVGGENFRPVGIALAPDGSLYCSDWVLRDYNLHGQGRVWRIAANGQPQQERPAELRIPSNASVRELRESLQSPVLMERRLAARSMGRTNPNTLLRPLRDATVSARARYEALIAVVMFTGRENSRVINMNVTRTEPPFDAVQTGVLSHFGDGAPIPRTLRLIEDAAGSDPEYLLRSLDGFSPVLRSYASSPTEAVAGIIARVLATNDPFVLARLTKIGAGIWSEQDIRGTLAAADSPPERVQLLLALAGRETAPASREIVQHLLTSRFSLVRRTAVQWAAEEGMTELRPQVQAVLHSEPMNTDLFLATLAALEMLDGKDPADFDQTPAGQYVLPLLEDEATSDAVKVQALRLVDPAEPAVTIDLLSDLLDSDDFNLRLEAVRTLALSKNPEAFDVLSSIAEDDDAAAQLRYEAILGLSHHGVDRAGRLLLKLLADGEPALQIEVLRSLREAAIENADVRNRLLDFASNRLLVQGRFPSSDEMERGAALQLAVGGDPQDWPAVLRNWTSQPKTDEGWRNNLALRDDAGPSADAERGRRVFFHPNGPQCYRCHTVNGRGGDIGPDLSTIGRSLTRDKLIESILHPSREVAPQFTTWTMATVDGEVHTGMIVHENKGETVLGTVEGELIELPTLAIDVRTPQRTSVMPEKLEERMTVQEFRDLLAFLQSLGGGG